MKVDATEQQDPTELVQLFLNGLGELAKMHVRWDTTMVACRHVSIYINIYIYVCYQTKKRILLGGIATKL